jgi:predicted ATPase
MRLDKLWIDEFRNLKDVSTDFDEKSLSTVLIGPNGSGKSNLLEALAWIFRNLDLLADPPFKYILEYEIREKRLRIDADPHRDRDKTQILVDGKKIPFRSLSDANRQYLPNNVFGYYSGVSRRFERIFMKHRDIFYQKIIRSVEPPLRPLFFARTSYGQFVLLAFFALGEKDATDFLKEYFQITGVDTIEFELKEPYWHQGKRQKEDLFWGAGGVVRRFLDDLATVSTCTEKSLVRINLPNRRSRTEERFSLVIKELELLQKLARKYQTNVEFFKMLESTSISDLIHRLRIKVKKESVEASIEFAELSEGEQQLLVVLGLLKFMKEDESLFLLDEPDTHLNPSWKLHYLDMLERVVGKHENSHIIIVTHDPLLVGGLTRKQVQVFSFGERGSIQISPPETDPVGLGVDGLLTSEMFGLNTTLDSKTQEKLNRRKELVVKRNIQEKELNPDEIEELNKLNETISRLGFVSTVRDPLYTKFLTALRKHELSEKIEFNALERKKQAELVEKLLAELEEEQE